MQLRIRLIIRRINGRVDVAGEVRSRRVFTLTLQIRDFFYVAVDEKIGGYCHVDR